MILKTM